MSVKNFSRAFSHRGLINKECRENSIEAFRNAFKNNFRAIEIDIWYLKKQLVLKHNRPNSLNNLTTLRELFLEFKNQVEYWLDFKNLHRNNCDEAIKEFKKLTDDLKINPQKLYFAPFIINFEKAKIIYSIIRKYFGNEAQIVAVIEVLHQENYQQFYNQLRDEKIYGLSIQHQNQYQNINQEFRKTFHDIEIFAWTINDQETAQYLEKIGVQNIATDKITPANQ